MTSGYFDYDYAFDKNEQVQLADWAIDEHCNRIITITKPEFRLRFFDINVLKFIEHRSIKFERTIEDYAASIAISSRGSTRVPSILFPHMQAHVPELEWGIWDSNYMFNDEFYGWLQRELLHEDNWWQHYITSL